MSEIIVNNDAEAVFLASHKARLESCRCHTRQQHNVDQLNAFWSEFESRVIILNNALDEYYHPL
jgi:hypothetical protein